MQAGISFLNIQLFPYISKYLRSINRLVHLERTIISDYEILFEVQLVVNCGKYSP